MLHECEIKLKSETLFDRIVLETVVLTAGFGIDPRIVVFPHQAVAAKEIAVKEAVFFDGVERVLRAARNIVASGAVSF